MYDTLWNPVKNGIFWYLPYQRVQDFFHQLYLIIFGGLTFGFGRYDGMILFFAFGFPLPNSGSARCRRGRCISEFKLRFSQKILYGLSGSKMKVHTLQGTNISPKNGILKMIFLFPRWDMLVPWRVSFCFWGLKNKVNNPQKLWLSFWDLKYRWVFTLKSFCWNRTFQLTFKDWKSGDFHHHFFHWVSSVKRGTHWFQRTDVPGRKLVRG